MRQPTPHTSDTPTIEGMHTSVQEAVSHNVARGAVYLAAAWEKHGRYEFEAHRFEETQVHWQGTRFVLGESGYYLPDSTRASWAMGKYNQGKEGAAAAYEWGEAAAYEWFLRLPPVVPLVVLWVVGVSLMGAGALMLYWVGRVLVRLLTGSI